MTCFGCGEPGHIRPNCPNRVRQVRSPGKKSVMLIDGSLAGQFVKNLRIDTGAECTVVHQDYVPEAAYTGHTCLLDTWRGAQFSRHRLVRINLRVGSVEVVKNVALVETLDYPALLGSDLGKEFTLALMNHIIDATNYQEPTPQKSCPPLIPCVAPVSVNQCVAPVSV